MRTKAVGHIRDARRMIVALSRARLGLYIFCRCELYCFYRRMEPSSPPLFIFTSKSLFENCYELAPVFKQLLEKPTQLELYPEER